MTSFRMNSGDTFVIEWSAVDEDNVAIDLTGAAIRWQLSDRSCTTPLIAKSYEGGEGGGDDGIAVTDAEGGLFTITLDPADTSDLYGRFRHEVQITLANGSVRSVRGRQATIYQDIVE